MKHIKARTVQYSSSSSGSNGGASRRNIIAPVSLPCLPAKSRTFLIQATARASSGSLAPAHGSGPAQHRSGDSSSEIPSGGDGGVDNEGGATGQGQVEEGGVECLTGYVRSVRDDLTAFVSSEGEAAAAAAGATAGLLPSTRRREDLAAGSAGVQHGSGGEGEKGAIGRTLAILARLGEDLGRMVRLRGRVEHQVQIMILPYCSMMCAGLSPIGCSVLDVIAMCESGKSEKHRRFVRALHCRLKDPSRVYRSRGMEVVRGKLLPGLPHRRRHRLIPRPSVP